VPKLIIPVGIIATAAVVATAYAVSFSSSSPADRSDCPGTIVCPLSGELVCKDRCPADSAETASIHTDGLAEFDADRADCPGRIECPLTGELVCKDRCPAEEAVVVEAVEADVLPACCIESE